MHDKWTFWYHNGKKELEILCKNGKIVEGQVYNDNGTIKKGRVGWA